MAELKLTYGLDSNERLVHVDDVPSGLACNCFCPECGAQIIARKGEKKQNHFAHANGADCAGARMTALHMLAQQIIEEEKKIRTPEYKGDYTYRDEEDVVFRDVMLEKQYQENGVNRRPDCIGIKDEKQLWIEITVTHGIDSEKKANIMANGISCIEIDLSSLLNKDYTEKNIRDILLTDIGHDMRKWTYNPEFAVEDEIMREEFIQKLMNEILIVSQTSLSSNQDERQYPDYIVAIREELSHVANFWMTSGTKEAAELVIYHIYNPYQDRDHVIHIGNFLVPNQDYLSFLVKSPKNQYTLSVIYAILDYDNRIGVSGRNVNITHMKTLLNELLKMPNCSEENIILKEGLMLLKEFIN